MAENLAKLSRKKLEWLERMDVTETVGTAESSELAEQQSDREKQADMDVEDDFKREMHLYVQFFPPKNYFYTIYSNFISLSVFCLFAIDIFILIYF